MGFEQAGFDVLAAVDLDPVHLAAHERNFPLCEPVCADVAEIAGAELMEAARRGWARRYPGRPFGEGIDCVFGGPSCQGFSVIGSRKQDDPRNGLIAEFARVVVELRPRWFVMENVPGLVSPRYKEALDSFRQTLLDGGYQVATPWRLNAKDHGAPQERKRVFIAGARAGEPLPVQPDRLQSAPTVMDALRDLPPLARFRTLRQRDALRLSDDQVAAMSEAQSEYVRRLNGRMADLNNLADQRTWDRALLTSVGIAVHSESVVDRFRQLRPGQRDETARLPKLDPKGQAPTLRAGTGRDHGSFTSARPVHYSSPRVITVREAARLHGFPDWFGFHSTKWHGFRQVGNAVPPPLARAAAGTVIAASGLQPSKRRGKPIAPGSDTLLSMPLTEAAEHYRLSSAKLPMNVRTLAAQQARRRAA